MSQGQAQPALDARSKAAYRGRLEELRDDQEEAERRGDLERAARAREESDFLARELAAAVGLGGRDRRAPSDAERARVNVTKAIKSAIARIGEQSPALGNHLARTVRTGTFCSYVPDPRLPATWRL
jgi:non-specific serine/threonine protein kinase